MYAHCVSYLTDILFYFAIFLLSPILFFLLLCLLPNSVSHNFHKIIHLTNFKQLYCMACNRLFEGKIIVSCCLFFFILFFAFLKRARICCDDDNETEEKGSIILQEYGNIQLLNIKCYFVLFFVLLLLLLLFLFSFAWIWNVYIICTKFRFNYIEIFIINHNVIRDYLYFFFVFRCLLLCFFSVPSINLKSLKHFRWFSLITVHQWSVSNNLLWLNYYRTTPTHNCI